MHLLSFIRHGLGIAVSVIGALSHALWRALRGRNSHADRAQWLHRWCAFMLRQLSIDIRTVGTFPAQGLIVSNHLSYLDIPVYSALAPCAFVSKSEVRKWPVFGLLAAIAGSIFVDRSRPALAHLSVAEMQQTLSSGVRVVLFPEGTSTAGDQVLPFKPALFESAVETGQPITAAHLRYAVDDGDATQEVCWWGGISFLPHLLRLMGKRRVQVTVQFDSMSERFTDRKQAAAALQTRVVALHQATVCAD